MARPRLTHLLTRESAEAERRCPRSKEAYARAGHLFGRVPMTWMNKTAGPFPRHLDTARVTDPRRAHVHRLLPRRHRRDGRPLARPGGATAMLPTEDAEWVGAELSELAD